LAELSIEKLTEWQAFFNLEPYARGWEPFAMLASVIANANRNPEEKPEPFTVEDFMPTSTDLSTDSIADSRIRADGSMDFFTESRIGTDEGDDDPEDEWDYQGDAPWPSEEEEPDKEPDWKRWKRNIRAYAESVTPKP
jgi:hypothetical protein